ncbi:hypothetical protein C0992_004880 [Termitomyces sp. T32_za158]|nr:hypothetical protein C0992_004880 [Termitomyces sp. T32_za158]
MVNLLHPSGPTTSGIPHFGVPGGRNYDYTKTYSPAKPGEEAKENARVWNVYLDEAENYDMDMIQGFRNIIDGLLIFATLFSAVVTTFVASTSQVLQPDNSQIVVSLFIENNRLLRAAGNITSIKAVPAAFLGPESRTYTSIDAWVNGLFFTSLALSLSTALLSVLAKQWIQAYTATVPGDAKTRALTRQFRFEGLVKWKLGVFIESLPLILHCSVAIFLVGLALYVLQFSGPMCGVIAGITAVTFLFYFGLSIIPAFDVACPYRIPFMFSLAWPLVFVSYMIQYACWSWNVLTHKPHMMRSLLTTLKMAEQEQVSDKYSVLPLHLAHNSLDWVFNHSSNHSVNEIVIEGTCGLLDELHTSYDNPPKSLFPSSEDPMEYLLSKSEDNLFVSTIKYALSRLLDMSSTASKDNENGKVIVYGRLIAASMKFSSIKALADEPITRLKEWQEGIRFRLLVAYAEALRKKHNTLSCCFLEWSGLKLLQSDSKWGKHFLFQCARLGDAKDLCDLVDQGIDLSCLDSHGFTALHHAACEGNLDGVIVFVEQKPALMPVLGKWLLPNSAWTALDVATYRGNSDVMGYLVDHGAKSSFHDVLYLALTNLEFPIFLDNIELLLDHGWDRTVKDANGRTLLDVACSKGNTILAAHLEDYQTVRLPPYGNTSHTMGEEPS